MLDHARLLQNLCSVSSSRPKAPWRLTVCCNLPANGGKVRQGSRRVQLRDGAASPGKPQGFAALATLLQERCLEQDRKSSKVRRSGRLSKETEPVSEPKTSDSRAGSLDSAGTRGRGEILQVYEQLKASASGTGNRIQAQSAGGIAAVTAGVSTVESTQPSLERQTSGEPSSFGEAVWAAMQLSALERQQKSKRRQSKKSRKNVSGVSRPNREDSAPLEEVKPLLVKAEWSAKIKDLERRMDALREIYYSKL